MSRTKIMIITLASLLMMISSSLIIENSQNPLQVNPPSAINNNQEIILRFNFDSTSNGLTYGQFFGIQFPSDFQDVDFSIPGLHQCSLTDGTNDIQLQAVISTTNQYNSIAGVETNIAYCQLVDTNFYLLSFDTNPYKWINK